MSRLRVIARGLAPFVWFVVAVIALQVYAPSLTGVDADDQPLWARPFFFLGSQPVSLLFLVKVAVFLILLTLAARGVSRILEEKVLRRLPLQDDQRFAIERLFRYATVLLGLVIGLQTVLDVDLSSLAFAGGALGLGIGIGLQSVASNFISGLVLLFERPIKVGDRVEVDGLNGDVIAIAARSTWIRTNDNVVIIVPNQDFITSRVINWTANDRLVRFRLPVGVSYGSQPDKVRDLLLGVARANPDVLTEPKPNVLFLGFGDSSLDFELQVWTTSKVNSPFVLKSDLYFEIFRVFGQQGIEIPFPQRDIHVKSIHAALPVSRTAASG